MQRDLFQRLLIAQLWALGVGFGVTALFWPSAWLLLPLTLALLVALWRTGALARVLDQERLWESSNHNRLNRDGEELRRERDRLESILGAMSEGVLVLDASERVVLANPSVRKFLKLPEDAGSVPPTLLDLNRLPRLHDLARRGLQGERATDEIALAEGLQVLVRTAPLAYGHPASAVLVFHDMTDLRRLEAVRRDLVANVSHELRTPLTAIRGYADTLQEGAIRDPVRATEFVAIIQRHSERLAHLLDDLLELSRLDAGSWPLKREPLALRLVVQRSLDLIRPKALSRSISLSTEAIDEPQVLGDAEGVERVLVNFLDNAVKYTPPGGQITLRAWRKGACWRIEVRDNGIGIEKLQQSRVFERFYRVDAGRSREMGGSGLGLAIVKHLSQGMGGSVGVESEPGQGSTFWLELPAAPEAAETMRPYREAGEALGAP